MSTLSALPRRRRLRWESALPVLGAAAAAALLGAAIALGYAGLVVALGLTAAGVALALSDWTWSVRALLVFLPFSGIFVLIPYPEHPWTVLIKDVLFVLPAYLGFFVARTLRKEPMGAPGTPLLLLGLFSIVVLAQMLNPALPNLVVGLIGAKVYLQYIPLVFLGYYLVSGRDDAHRLMGLMTAVAVIPAVVGLIEAMLFYSGRAQLVYGLYGAAAESATQGFSAFAVGGQEIRRVPSTFSFVAQYYVFLAAMICVTYAWWRGAAPGTRAARLGGPAWALMVVAALTSGARGAFLFVPFLILMTLYLDRDRLRSSPWVIAGGAAGMLFAVLMLGTGTAPLVEHVYGRAANSLDETFLSNMRDALALTWVGLGAGIDTAAARFALPEIDPYGALGGTRFESYWVKAAVELGILGLAITVAMLSRLVFVLHRRHLLVTDPRTNSMTAALLALAIWLFLYNLKAPYLDIDPLNVYFWLFAGILLRLACPPSPAESAGPPAPDPAGDP